MPARDAPDTPRHAVPTLLVPAEAGRRNRRPLDAVVLLATAFLLALTVVVATSAEPTDADVAAALTTVLGWAPAFWRLVLVAALALAVAIVLACVARRRWLLARDLVLALLLALGAGIVIGRLVESTWFVLGWGMSDHWGFPDLRVAAVAAVIAVAGPELVQPVRRLAHWMLLLAALGSVALGSTSASSALGGLAVGLVAAAAIRFGFGSAAAVPPSETVRAAMAALGVAVDDLHPASRQSIGAAAYVGRDAAGRELRARVLGRDAQDTQRYARRWRLLLYRDPPRSAPVGRLEQVEHEALAALMAAQAGVRTPAVATAALGPDGDALVVTREPDVAPLEEMAGDTVDEATLADLWHQVALLQAAGISHGRLNLANVVAVDGRTMLTGWAAATLGAPASALAIDVAELLVACTVLVGPDRALAAALAGVGPEPIGRALPYLQRGALTPHVRDLAHGADVQLAALREEAAAATGQEVPDLVPLRRIRARDFVVTALVAFAFYLIISQLAEIGFGTIADQLREADVTWVVVALLTAQLTFVAAGTSLRGAVLTPLPLLPCVVLQSAIKFINLTVPGSTGSIALTIRFLQRMGAPTPEAVGAGAVDGISETVVQIVVVLVTLPFVNIAVDTDELQGKGPSGHLITVVVLLLALAVVGVLAVPQWRAKVLPPIESALRALWAVARTRRKRLELFGGNIMVNVLFALTLGAVCHAYGVDLSLPELLFVNTAASAFAGLVPVPGGVGAAEATLTAGLVALGVDQSTAFAIALTHRLCTYYLPPIWGYASLKWLGRKGYV